MPDPIPPANRPLLLAGPTAVGKSEVALALAERLDGEIVSVDSMQVYRGLDIGTAKPTPAERRRVPHHLIDVAGLNESFDAAQFVRLAQEAVAGIQSRNRVPILCGGTGLYFKAFLDGLGEAPPADAALRAELEQAPLVVLLAELERSDPVTFQRIDRCNPRRVIRAVEVIRLTGKPFSAQRASWPAAKAELDPNGSIWLILRQSHDLLGRINARVDLMFRSGLVDEVQALMSQRLESNKTAFQAIGYRQVVEHLRGERSLAETIELVKVRTRQFAKRQLTWFRRQASVTVLKVQPDETAAAIADRIMRGR